MPSVATPHSALSPPLSTKSSSLPTLAWDQPATPPYAEELQAALSHSLDHATIFFVNYLWEHRDSLQVIHPWLRAAVLLFGQEQPASVPMLSYESAYCDKIKEVMTENRRGKIWQELRVQQPI